MNPKFERSGIRFDYPGNWSLDLEEQSDGWEATLQSPQTAFMLVSLRPDVETAALFADQVFSALKSEYPDLDAEPVIESFAGLPAIGHDMDFLTLDTSITCRTRCLETPSGPLVVMCQVSEFDRERNDPLLRAICASFRIEEDL